MQEQLISRRGALGLIGAVGVMSALPACASSGPTGKATADKFTLGWSSFGNESLNPATLATNTQVIYMEPLYDFLTYLKRGTDKFEIDEGSGLATSVEQTSDGMGWTFKLRDGVTFHDGSALTADDVVYTFKLYMSDESTHGAKAYFVATIDDITADDPMTVTFHTKGVQGDFPARVSDLIVQPILPKAYLEKVGLDGFAKAPIGSGPYKFVSQSLGSNIVMKKLDKHWRNTATYEQLEFRLMPEASTRLSALGAGEVDAMDLDFSQLKQLSSKDQTLETANASVVWVNLGGMVDETSPQYDGSLPWMKPEVRQAMSMAIDRDALVKTVYAGKAAPAGAAPWITGELGYPPDLVIDKFDPDGAKQLLQQAGFADGFPIEIQAFPLAPNLEMPDVAEALAIMWQAVGIKAKVKPTDFTAIRTPWTARSLKAVWPMRMIPFPDITPDLTTFFHSTGALPVANSKEIDSLVEAAQKESSPEARGPAVTQLIKHVTDNRLAIPLVYASALVGKGPKVAAWDKYPGQGYRLPWAQLKPA